VNKPQLGVSFPRQMQRLLPTTCLLQQEVTVTWLRGTEVERSFAGELPSPALDL